MHADLVYKQLMEDVLTKGKFKGDRTGTGTVSLFGPQAEYDLQEGFPALTTKKVAIKTLIHELLWFIKGDTDLKSLTDVGVRIWLDDGYRDAIEKGYRGTKEEFELYVRDNGYDMGAIYGAQWVSWAKPSGITKVEPRIVGKEALVYPVFPRLAVSDSGDNLVGKTLNNTLGNSYRVISKTGTDSQGRSLYDIQFDYTGYVKRGVRRDVVQKGNVKDLYYPSVSGVGCVGEYEIKTKLDKTLYKSWTHMLERCYNEQCKEYPYYGALGVFVSARWLNFSNFRKDVESLPNWRNKRIEPSNYQIDKDYYMSNCYSIDTCVWLSKQENILYRNSKAFTVTTPDNLSFQEVSISEVARRYGLQTSKISKVLKGGQSKHKGFSFEYIEEGEKYRYHLPINQLQQVIDEIRNNPDSRRLLVTAWNPTVLDEVALPSCHAFFQLYVQDGELSCKMYQRSADGFLGVPFNIPSYAILTHIIAKMTGLKVGKFIHTFGDMHIYSNHIDQVKEQLAREPKPMPQINIKKVHKRIEDYTIDDIEIIGYDPHPPIKGKLSVGL